MSKVKYSELLTLVTSFIEYQNTVMRKVISPHERLNGHTTFFWLLADP